MPGLKKFMTILFRGGVSIALLFFLLRGVDKKTLFELIKNSNKLFLFYAFAVYFVIYPLTLLRWNFLLKASKVHLPLKKVIDAFSSGIFFNLFLPSTIGGDFMRSMDLAAHTKKPKEIVASVFLDRLSGYIGLVIISLLAIVLGVRIVEDKSVLVSLLVISGMLFFILCVLFNNTLYSKINKLLQPSGKKNTDKPGVSAFGKIKETLSNFHQQVYRVRHDKKVILNSLSLSFFIQVISPVSFYFLGLSLGIKINIVYYFVFLPLIGAITLLPISIGGLGLRDATTIYFFAKAGVSKDLALAMSLLNFSFILIFGSIGGLIYVLALHNRRLQRYKSSELCLRS